jgi:hypothetical protein
MAINRKMAFPHPRVKTPAGKWAVRQFNARDAHAAVTHVMTQLSEPPEIGATDRAIRKHALTPTEANNIHNYRVWHGGTSEAFDKLSPVEQAAANDVEKELASLKAKKAAIRGTDKLEISKIQKGDMGAGRGRMSKAEFNRLADAADRVQDFSKVAVGLVPDEVMTPPHLRSAEQAKIAAVDQIQPGDRLVLGHLKNKMTTVEVTGIRDSYGDKMYDVKHIEGKRLGSGMSGDYLKGSAIKIHKGGAGGPGQKRVPAGNPKGGEWTK